MNWPKNTKSNSKYEIEFDPLALKNLNKILKKDKKEGKLILEGIQEIQKDPYNSKFLKHFYKGLRRKRKGKYRIIFKISQEKDNTIIIAKIGKRDIYII